jgi:hypothetical protein
MLLPDTYRHQLPADDVRNGTEISPLFARLDMDLRVSSPRRGQRISVGLGMVRALRALMTEQLSRLWAWHNAKSRFPTSGSCSTKRESDEIAPWERGLLHAAGIAADDVMVIATPIQAEQVIRPRRCFDAPLCEPSHRTGVGRCRRGLARWLVPLRPRRASSSAGAARTLVHNRDRRNGLHRRRVHSCISRGSAVRRTSSDIPNAEVVAGYAGSYVHLTLCESPKRVLLVCSEGYILTTST